MGRKRGAMVATEMVDAAGAVGLAFEKTVELEAAKEAREREAEEMK